MTGSLVIDGVSVYLDATPERCAACGSSPVVLVRFDRFAGGGEVTLCGTCALDLAPEPTRPADAPARRRRAR